MGPCMSKNKRKGSTDKITDKNKKNAKKAKGLEVPGKDSSIIEEETIKQTEANIEYSESIIHKERNEGIEQDQKNIEGTDDEMATRNYTAVLSLPVPSQDFKDSEIEVRKQYDTLPNRVKSEEWKNSEIETRKQSETLSSRVKSEELKNTLKRKREEFFLSMSNPSTEGDNGGTKRRSFINSERQPRSAELKRSKSGYEQSQNKFMKLDGLNLKIESDEPQRIIEKHDDNLRVNTDSSGADRVEEPVDQPNMSEDNCKGGVELKSDEPHHEIVPSFEKGVSLELSDDCSISEAPVDSIDQDKDQSHASVPPCVADTKIESYLNKDEKSSQEVNEEQQLNYSDREIQREEKAKCDLKDVSEQFIPYEKDVEKEIHIQKENTAVDMTPNRSIGEYNRDLSHAKDTLVDSTTKGILSKDKNKKNKNIKKKKSSKPKDNNEDVFRNERPKQDMFEGIKSFRPPSLTNMGATCYLNSAFQGISACDTFVKEVDDLCETYADYDAVSQLHVFKELIDILNGCSKNRMEISRNPIFRNWNKPGQQDSYELLAYALNQVYNQLRKHKETIGHIAKRDLKRWLEVKLPMRFIMQYQIKCGCGLITYSPMQSDLALHVTIPQYGKDCVLNELVDLYFGDDPIEDYECDRQECDGKNTHRIARLAKPLPSTICIHLQRTFWNGWEMKKINKEVKFDTQLIMKSKYWSQEENLDKKKSDIDNIIDGVVNGTDNHMDTLSLNCNGRSNESGQGSLNNSIEAKHINGAEVVPKVDLVDNKKDNHVINGKIISKDGTQNDVIQNGEDSKKQIWSKEEISALDRVSEKDIDSECPIIRPIDNEGEKDEMYDLVSVIVHWGTVYGGHYTCYKRVGTRWFLTNDSSVHEVREEEVLGCQAYILFYEQPYQPGQSKLPEEPMQPKETKQPDDLNILDESNRSEENIEPDSHKEPDGPMQLDEHNQREEPTQTEKHKETESLKQSEELKKPEERKQPEDSKKLEEHNQREEHTQPETHKDTEESKKLEEHNQREEHTQPETHKDTEESKKLEEHNQREEHTQPETHKVAEESKELEEHNQREEHTQPETHKDTEESKKLEEHNQREEPTQPETHKDTEESKKLAEQKQFEERKQANEPKQPKSLNQPERPKPSKENNHREEPLQLQEHKETEEYKQQEEHKQFKDREQPEEKNTPKSLKQLEELVQLDEDKVNGLLNLPGEPVELEGHDQREEHTLPEEHTLVEEHKQSKQTYQADIDSVE